MKLRLYALASRIEILDRSMNAIRDNISFRKFKNQGSFSQHGEDLFLHEYFGEHRGHYIDIGASHPFRISNTFLLYQLGWSGLIVEPIERLCQLHRKWRPKDVQVCAAVGEVESELQFYELIPSVLSSFDALDAQKSIEKGASLRSQRKVQVHRVQTLYDKHFQGKEIDLLSIDAEGFDEKVLLGVDWEKLRPRLVIFESNDSVSESDLTPADRILLKNGYRSIKQIGCNRVYENTRQQNLAMLTTRGAERE